jgi:hypothetical protein
MRERRSLLTLFALLGGLVVVGIVSTSRIFGEFYDYVVRWWWIIVAWLFIAAILAVARAAGSRQIGAAMLVLAILMSALSTAHAIGERNPGPRNSQIVGALTKQVSDSLDRHSHYLVRWYDPVTLGGVGFGVLLELEKRGVKVGVDAVNSAGALPHRVLPESSANAALWVVHGDVAIESMLGREDAVELGYFDPRSADEVAESARLRAELVSLLRQSGLDCSLLDRQYGLAQLVLGLIAVPDSVVSRAKRYDDLGQPAAVFETPAAAPPVTPAFDC